GVQRLEEGAGLATLPIPQIAGPQLVNDEAGLPSTLYLPAENAYSPGDFKLPWTTNDALPVVGSFARIHGPNVPERSIHSAKSWLCNPNIHPDDAVLPWQSSAVEEKLSPLDASTAYLAHVKASFTMALAENSIDAEDTLAVITVPASFDEAARRATQKAAENAGFGSDTLFLEEPLAAVYAWIENEASAWRDQLEPGQLLFVCDIGGGTSDFSLIAVDERDGELSLERIAVGKHILLGGDNLDLALAYVLRSQIEATGQTLDEWQFRSLIQASRIAKETLFSNADLAAASVSVPSRSSSLFAGTLSTELSRDTLQAVAVDGFFADVEPHEHPATTIGSALQELGLPYEADPVVTKHIGAFLTQARAALFANPELLDRLDPKGDRFNGNFLSPDVVLFNGGAFHAEVLRERVISMLSRWAGRPVNTLAGAQLDAAVARGAAIYGRMHLSGDGMRIRAGAAHSMYIGIASSMPAIPGFKPPVQALCVVPQGMEEGSGTVLERELGLVTGRSVSFKVFSSSGRPEDVVGQLIPDAERMLEASQPLEMAMPEVEGIPSGEAIPVKLHARLNETGTLELWMQHTRSERRFKIDFKVRLD
ncbi:MAG: Hsp70 family protein, partial [Verrucomicrobiota bacterium]